MATKKGRRGTRKAGSDNADSTVGSGEFQSGSEVRTALVQRETGVKAIQYTVVDGMAVFEGDIILGTVEQVEQETEQLRSGAQEAVLITGARFRWPDCRIPFTIDPALTSRNRVTEAIAHWEANTRFRFIPRTTETAFVTFRPGTGCSSAVGRQGNQQFVNLAGGCLRGQTIHEIGHVIGLWHEQSRQDRDTFVRINWANIQAGKEHNFNQHITDGDDIGLYDYDSIMHYERLAFSRNNVSPTIEPINPSTATIGQRDHLSAGDIAAANSLCGGVVTIKEPVIDTRKELVKDVRSDTFKEITRDTRKELIDDPIKRFDPIKPGDPVKRDTIDPIRRRAITLGGRALPLAIAARHQAPAAGGSGGENAQAATDASELDAQLRTIAEELTQAQAVVESLQQQYDETYSLLNSILDQQDPQGR